MRIATYWWGGQRHVGRLSDDGARVTALACGERAREVGALALIEALADGRPLPRTTGTSLPLAAVKLDAPIPVPRRNIFCSGVNYRAHAAEWAASGIDRRAGPAAPAAPVAQEDPPYPVIFSKVADCVVGPGVPIRMPEGVSDAIDYEAELAVLIGRPGRNIPAARAMEHVFGYTILNDVTARDVQTRHRQWLLGKSFDTFGPMGPCIAGVDELDGQNTRVRCWVNDELRQDARTTDLIFDIPTLIETVSRGITLYPGDVIATGTPAGVGMGLTPPSWLKTGDVVRIEIDGIGTLSNRFE